jgi:DNA-binding HxlR family transcriptional regulator
VKSYEEACGLARGLDVVGERWTLLVIRELLFGPKRFTDLEEGMPGVPPSLLSTRLKELTDAGLVERRVLAPPAASTVYELTDAGRELEESLVALAKWGARYGRPMTPEDQVRAEWMALGMKWLFKPEEAAGVHATYEMRYEDQVLTAQIDDGRADIAIGEAIDPDLTVEVLDTEAGRQMLVGELPAPTATSHEFIRVTGTLEAMELFLRIFALPSPHAAPTA